MRSYTFNWAEISASFRNLYDFVKVVKNCFTDMLCFVYMMKSQWILKQYFREITSDSSREKLLGLEIFLSHSGKGRQEPELTHCEEALHMG